MSIIKNKFSNIILSHLYKIIEEIRVPPGEVIFKENDTDDLSIYFICDG